jgi:hypothetical protein
MALRRKSDGFGVVGEDGVMARIFQGEGNSLRTVRIPIARLLTMANEVNFIGNRLSDSKQMSWVVGVSAPVDPAGQPSIEFDVGASNGASSPFLWIQKITDEFGNSVNVKGGSVIVDGPNGRMVIDSKTGALIEYARLSTAGFARLTITKMTLNQDLPDELFDLPTDEMPALETRRIVAEYTIGRMLNDALRDVDSPNDRMDRCIRFASKFYQFLWSDCEIARMSELGIIHQEEVFKNLTTKLEDVPKNEVAKAARVAAISAIEESIVDEIKQDSDLFLRTARPGDVDLSEQFRRDLAKIAMSSILTRVEREMDRPK